MDATNPLPNDLTECHQLLVAAFQQSVQLEQQAAEAEQRAAASEQQVAELGRVLDETAASHEVLQQEHAATLEELAWYKRWAFGGRRERFAEGAGQGHLFDLDSAVASELEDSANSSEEVEIKGHRRRKNRKIDWDKLHQIHHDHDLNEEEKMCSCCGKPMQRIGEDVTPTNARVGARWNTSRPSWKLTFMCAPNTLAVVARMASRQLPFQLDRFQAASPDLV